MGYFKEVNSMRKECARIQERTCKKCSACEKCEFYKEPQDQYLLPYGYGMWGGQIRDMLPHGKRYYMGIDLSK